MQDHPATIDQNRSTSRLRFGRVSVPGAVYFITFCTKDRIRILTLPNTGKNITAAINAMHEAGDIVVTAATVMPDHVHLLLTLGYRLQIGQVVEKIKTMARNHDASWRWQDDGFEHRVRMNESIEDYAFYIFMNPYRAGLCPLSASWPWWLCPQPEHFQFLATLNPTQAVPSAWMGLSDAVASRIPTGE